MPVSFFVNTCFHLGGLLPYHLSFESPTHPPFEFVFANCVTVFVSLTSVLLNHISHTAK